MPYPPTLELIKADLRHHARLHRPFDAFSRVAIRLVTAGVAVFGGIVAITLGETLTATAIGVILLLVPGILFLGYVKSLHRLYDEGVFDTSADRNPV